MARPGEGQRTHAPSNTLQRSFQMAVLSTKANMRLLVPSPFLLGPSLNWLRRHADEASTNSSLPATAVRHYRTRVRPVLSRVQPALAFGSVAIRASQERPAVIIATAERYRDHLHLKNQRRSLPDASLPDSLLIYYSLKSLLVLRTLLKELRSLKGPFPRSNYKIVSW